VPDEQVTLTDPFSIGMGSAARLRMLSNLFNIPISSCLGLLKMIAN